MKEGYFVIRTIEAGDVGEKTKFFVPGKKPENGKLSRRQKNAVKKQEQNEYASQKRLAREINANFKAGDLFLGLDYSDEGLQRILQWGRTHGLSVDSENPEERQNAIWEAAAHELDNALRRVKRRLEKQGTELKAVYCTADMDGDTGELVRVHHHLIVQAGTADAFVSAWEKYGLGSVTWSALWANQIDRTPIAEYIIRQVRRIPDAKKYRSTRNLVHPVPTTRIVSTDNELLVPRGGRLIYRQEYRNNAGGRDDYRNYQSQYIRYITPKALRRMEEERAAVQSA